MGCTGALPGDSQKLAMVQNGEAVPGRFSKASDGAERRSCAWWALLRALCPHTYRLPGTQQNLFAWHRLAERHHGLELAPEKYWVALGSSSQAQDPQLAVSSLTATLKKGWTGHLRCRKPRLPTCQPAGSERPRCWTWGAMAWRYPR